MESRRSRRNPDGSPAIRSVDDLLAEAVKPESIEHLSGKGRPLNLAGYFHADPEQRVASRLMRDNNVLPQPLQDRRDAEVSRLRIEEALDKAQQELAALEREIHQLSACLLALHPQARSHLPQHMLHPAASPLMADATTVIQELVTSIEVYRSRRRRDRQRQVDLAVTARDKTRELNEQVMLNRHLPASLQMTGVDTQSCLATFDATIRDIAALPEQIIQMVPRRRSWWHRLLAGKTTL